VPKPEVTAETRLPALDQLQTAIAAGNTSKVDALRAEILRRPTGLETFLDVRNVYAKEGRFEEGYKIVKQGLESLRNLTPDQQAEAHRYLGGDSFLAGDKEQSRKHYEQAYKLDPSSPTIQNDYAYSIAENGGDLHFAKQMAEYAVAKAPDQGNAYDTLGWVLYKMDKPRDAVPLFQKSIQLRPLNPEACYHMGRTMEKLGRNKEAVAAYERAYEMRQAHPILGAASIDRIKHLDLKAYSRVTSVKSE